MMNAAPRPIILFSLPRAGSTLVQRVLATYDEISTRPEPWVLLPQIYALREFGISADYRHPLLVNTLNEFIRELPGGHAAYYHEVRSLALNLYAKASEPSARYFLDKSPPYSLVAEDVIRLFPEGKFVFLWRNPLSVLSSWIETFFANRWRPDNLRPELFIGLQNLTATYQRHREQAIGVRYEDLIVGHDPWERLMAYLEMEFDPTSLTAFQDVELQGLGDPTGPALYSEINTDPLSKWKSTICNPLRREWSRRYLRWIGAERLAVMGYELSDLLAELDQNETGTEHLTQDALHLVGRVLRDPVRQRARRMFGLRGPSTLRLLLSPAQGKGS